MYQVVLSVCCIIISSECLLYYNTSKFDQTLRTTGKNTLDQPFYFWLREAILTLRKLPSKHRNFNPDHVTNFVAIDILSPHVMFSRVPGSRELQELRVRRPSVPRRGARGASHQVVLQARLATRSQARGGDAAEPVARGAAEEAHQGHDAVPAAHAASHDETTQGDVYGGPWNAEADHHEGRDEQGRVRDIHVTRCAIQLCVPYGWFRKTFCTGKEIRGIETIVNGEFKTGYLPG